MIANALVEPFAVLNAKASSAGDDGLLLVSAAHPERVDEGPVQVVKHVHAEEDERHRLERVVRPEVDDCERDRRGRLHDDPQRCGVEGRAPAGAEVAAVGRGDEHQQDEADDPEDDDTEDGPGVDRVVVRDSLNASVMGMALAAGLVGPRLAGWPLIGSSRSRCKWMGCDRLLRRRRVCVFSLPRTSTLPLGFWAR